MARSANPIPKGFHTVTPYLAISDGAQAIDFYKKAFGATEVMRMNGPDGKISHAEIKIGDSIIMLGSAPPNSDVKAPQQLNGSTVSIFLYLDDVDKTFKQALDSGAKEVQALADQPWGDRYGRLSDPFGHSWSLATHIEDVSEAEMAKRMKEMTEKRQRAQAAG
jgi:PhnB protein